MTAFLIISLNSSAQIQQAWVARYNNGITNGTNQAVKMALDSAGNIYVTGFSQNTNNNLGYVTIKYAPNGSQVWAARFDSTNYPNASPAAMVLDSSNNVIITGTALTVKYDSNGNQLWTAPYAGGALAVDSNANVYVDGYSQDFATAKLSAQGSNVWVRNYPDAGPTVSQTVLVDSNANVYVAGSDAWNCRAGCYEQLLMVKYDSSGNQLWTAIYNPGGPVVTVHVGGATLDGLDNLYLLASLEGAFMGYETFKYSSGGNLIWMATPNDNGYSVGTGLVLDTAANVLVTGKAGNDAPNFTYGTFKINTNGPCVWTNYYPQPPAGVSVATSIAVDAANSSYVTGYSPGAKSGNDIVTIKYDPNGKQIGLQRYNGLGNGNDAGNAIAVDKNGNVYVTGYETLPGGGTGIVTIKYIPVGLQLRSDGTVLLEVQGSPGESFDIQASQDLLNWLDLGTFLADTNGLMQFNDTNAPNFPARFYYTNPQ